MPDVQEQEGMIRKIIRIGWRYCLAFLLGGIVVFLYTCTKQ